MSNPKSQKQDIFDGLTKEIEVAVEDTPIVVFICGPAYNRNGGSNKLSAQARFFVSEKIEKIGSYAIWGEHRKLRRASPQSIRKQFSDADKEIAFASRKAHLIVIFPDSPGSLAELGAFSMYAEIAGKLLVFFDKKRKNNKGFVVNALMKTAKNQDAKVFFVNYLKRDRIWKIVEENIRAKQSGEVRDSLGRQNRSQSSVIDDEAG